MAKQPKPKVSDLVEILLQELKEFQGVTKERNEALSRMISDIKNIKVEFDVAEYEAMERSHRAILKKDFEKFHAQTRRHNRELLKVHKRVSSSRLLYITILNIFIFVSTGAAIYVSLGNSLKASELEALEHERNRLKQQVENIDGFFMDNPEAALSYKDWSDQ